jgi:hypothetical protein
VWPEGLGNTEAVDQLFIDFKKAYDILIEFVVLMRLGRLIKMC